MGKGTCFYCDDTGEIPTLVEGVPDQMCPYCEIGQAMLRGYNKANSIQLGNYEQLQAEVEQLKAQLKIEYSRGVKDGLAEARKIVENI